MTAKQKTEIKKLWKKGRNIWEISQITGVSESEVQAFVATL